MVDREGLKLETELEINCIEDEKSGLMEFKENLIKKVEDIENGEYMGTQSDVIDRIKRMDNL